MEIKGYVGSIVAMDETPEIRFIGVHYGFCHLRYLVVWTTIDSDQINYAWDAYYREYQVGMRVDRETKELLAIW